MLLIFSAVISWLVTLLALQRASSWHLVQTPNHRSSHDRPTPTGGGIGFVFASTAIGAWAAYRGAAELWIVVGLALTLAVVGLVDDITHVPAKVRFSIQIALVALLLSMTPEWSPVTMAQGTMSIKTWGLSAGLLLAGIWWINLFNFMDGIDGLAGIQAISMLVVGATLAVWHSPQAISSPEWMLMICVACACAAFLWFNWPPARIFMGDVGSTWLSFMILAFALYTVHVGWLRYGVWLVLAAAFVSDATATLSIRLLRGERWYEAHRSHAYQRLARRWHGPRKSGHRSVTMLFSIIDLIWLAPIALAVQQWPQWTLLWLLLAYTPLICGALWLGAGRPDHA